MIHVLENGETVAEFVGKTTARAVFEEAAKKGTLVRDVVVMREENIAAVVQFGIEVAMDAIVKAQERIEKGEVNVQD